MHFPGKEGLLYLLEHFNRVIVQQMKITTLFMSLYSAKMLTWHDNNIPREEVWVKLGGDKGGGSFKMSFQVHSNDMTLSFGKDNDTK